MNISHTLLLTITVCLFTACASEPAQTVKDPYNDADSQRKRAEQAQHELERDTAK